MKATIKDIANITGYSVATVSRALNGKEVVGEKTRTRIQEVARELHYVPNAFARSLQKSRGAIGLRQWVMESSITITQQESTSTILLTGTVVMREDVSSEMPTLMLSCLWVTSCLWVHQVD